MTKWLVTGFIAATVLILVLVWHFGMKPAPIGLIKPSPFHSAEVTGQVLADRFFVDIQGLETVVFAYRNEKNLMPIAKAFIERLPERGIQNKRVLIMSLEEEKKIRSQLIKETRGRLMVWSDNIFAVEDAKAEEIQSRCKTTDTNAYVMNPDCRSARYSKLHLLKKKLDPSQPYFGAQRFGAFDYELYFYTP